MLNKISKKTWAVIAAALVIVIGILVFSTSVSDAMTLKEATKLATSKMPSTAEYVNGEEGDNKFEIMFHDKDKGMKYKVEISKKTEEVKEIEAQADNITRSDKVVLKVSEVQNIIKNNFEGVKDMQIELEKEHGNFEYDVDFTADDFYGDAELNAETGAINEFTIKAGTATVVPEQDKNSSNGDFISYKKAKEIAIEAAGGGTVSDIEFEEENGNYYYEVEVLNGNTEYDYVIDARSGKVQSEDEFEQFFEQHDNDDDYDDDRNSDDNDKDFDDDDDDDKTVIDNHTDNTDNDQNTKPEQNQNNSSKPSEDKKFISEDEVKNIVLKKIGNADIIEIEFEKDDGKYIYEIEAEDDKYEYELEIDAASGVITEFSKEVLDDDDDEFDD